MLKNRKLLKEQLEGITNATTFIGLPQHMKKDGTMDRGAYAYSSDDQARFLQVWNRFPDFNNQEFQVIIPEKLLDYAEKVERGDGLFENYVDECGRVVHSNKGEVYDVFGRWMLSFAEVSESQNKMVSQRANKLFENHLDASKFLLEDPTPHSIAFLSLALSEKLNGNERGSLTENVRRLRHEAISRLQEFYEEHSRPDWQWVDDEVNYCGGRFPQAFLAAYSTGGNEAFLRIGESLLSHFTSVSFEKEMFWPVGNKGWFSRCGVKALYDQQTIEAGVGAVAYNLAFQVTQKQEYQRRRDACIKYFSGKNSRGVSLLRNGGVCDAVTDSEEGVNTNQGAESRIAFLMAMSTFPNDQ